MKTYKGNRTITIVQIGQGQEWSTYNKIIDSYSPTNEYTVKEIHYWMNDQWFKSFYDSVTYTPSGKIESTTNMSFPTPNINGNFLHTYISYYYDAQDSLTSFDSYTWNNITEEFIHSNRTTVTYDGTYSFSINEAWDATTQQWNLYFKKEIDVDNDNREIRRSEYFYSQGDWMLTQEVLSTYNSMGLLTEREERKRPNASATVALNFKKVQMEYDNQGRVISEIIYNDQQFHADWNPKFKTLTTYNDADRTIFYDYYIYAPSTNNWVSNYTSLHLYNTMGLVYREIIDYEWASYLNKYIDYYHTSCELLTVESPIVNTLQLYPNPVTSDLYIAISEPLSVVVYTVNGTIHMEATLSEGQNTIDLSGLVSGIYLLRFSDGTTHKIVKQ